jgi:PAS domain S-box-containing protein
MMAAGKKSISVLIIEDHQEQAHLMEVILHRHEQPFMVRIEPRPEQALSLLQSEAFEAVVLDYSLPRMNGLELLAEIKKQPRPPAVVMVTGQGDERIAVEAMRQGAYDYLVKTRDLLDLLPRVLIRAVEELHLSSQLQQSEQRYYALFEKAVVGIFIVDAASLQFIQVNEMACKITGYSQQDLLPYTLNQIVSNRHQEALTGFLAKIRRDGQATLDQLLLIRSSKNLAPVDISASLVALTGVPVIQCFIHDISEKIKMQRQLLLSRQRLISLFDGISDPISVQDKDHHLIMGNKKYVHTIVNAASKLSGEKCYRALFDRSDPCPDCPARETYETGHTRFIEIIHRGRTFHIWTFPMVGLDGKPELVAEYVKDVTEQKEIERQLIKSEKLATIGLLSSGIAHELRNPLNVIETVRYSLEDLLSHKQPELDKKLDIIKKNVRRASVIIENLLQFSKHSIYERETIDVEKLIDTTLSLLEKEIALRNISCEKTFENTSRAWFSLDSLKQVFLNIIYNAVQAMPNGGLLRINTHSQADPDWVIIDFTDSGVGISGENLKHVFTPFFSTKQHSGGTGLGLYISYSLIKREGGDLQVKSREGLGATFTVKLPAAKLTDVLR